MEKMKQKFDLQEMTLKHLIGMKEIQDIATSADREICIQKELNDMGEVFRTMLFEVSKHTLPSLPTTDRWFAIKGDGCDCGEAGRSRAISAGDAGVAILPPAQGQRGAMGEESGMHLGGLHTVDRCAEEVALSVEHLHRK
jgi:hypothetical protein